MILELNEKRDLFLYSINYFKESPSREIVNKIYHLINLKDPIPTNPPEYS